MALPATKADEDAWRAGYSPRDASASLPRGGAKAPRGLKPTLQASSTERFRRIRLATYSFGAE